MTKLNEVLSKMVEGAGISVTEATIKSILDNPALASIEVDDAMSTKLTAPRMTMEAAKNNPDLHKHFTATILNGVDKKVYDSAKDFGLNDEDINELKAIQNSYDRTIALTKKVQALEAKKAGSTGKDKDAFTKEIDKLNSDIAAIRKQFDTEKSELLSKFEEERNGFKLDSVFDRFTTQMDKTKSHDVNKIVAKTITQNELQKRGLKIVTKDGNLTLVNSEGLDYHDNNVKVGVDDFVSKVLANEKLLIASNATGTQKTTKSTQSSRNNEDQGNGLKVDNYLAALESEA